MSSPLSDLGILVVLQLLAVVTHHRGALVRHAKLVNLHRRTVTALLIKSEGGGGHAVPACGLRPPSRHPCAAVGCIFLSPAHEVANVMHDNMQHAVQTW